jgi:hypothetical protein
MKPATLQQVHASAADTLPGDSTNKAGLHGAASSHPHGHAAIHKIAHSADFKQCSLQAAVPVPQQLERAATSSFKQHGHHACAVRTVPLLPYLLAEALQAAVLHDLKRAQPYINWHSRSS